MSDPSHELGPVLFQPSDELFDELGDLSGRAIRVLFGYLRRLDGNHVKATQAEISEILRVHPTAISKGFQELEEHELVLREWNGVYRVRHFYRGQSGCVDSALCMMRAGFIASHVALNSNGKSATHSRPCR